MDDNDDGMITLPRALVEQLLDDGWQVANDATSDISAAYPSRATQVLQMRRYTRDMSSVKAFHEAYAAVLRLL
jgi:hypothetical protein